MAVSIHEFIDDWKDGGYGIAFISEEDIVIDPYVDPDDYPDLILSRSGNGATVINKNHKYEGYYFFFHSGCLEDLKGKNLFSEI